MTDGTKALFADGPQIALSLHEGHALEIALVHGPTCTCENCTTAVFAIQREMKPYKAVGSPRDEDVQRAEAEIRRAEYQVSEGKRKLALLTGEVSK